MYDLSWQAYNAIIAKEMCSKYWSGEEEEQRSSRGEDKHATTCEPRQSRLLTSIHVPHDVVSVERDGNCFYSSCSYLLRRLHVCDISPCELRCQVERGMTQEEKDLSSCLDTTNSGFADHVEISVCSRIHSVSIIILNDTEHNVTLHAGECDKHAGECDKHAIVLLLDDVHYEPVTCSYNLLHLFGTNQTYIGDIREAAKLANRSRLRRYVWSVVWPF